MTSQEEVWPLIDLLFRKRSDLYRHQYENYDFFIQKIIPQEIRNSSIIDEHEDQENNKFYTTRFKFKNFNLKPAALENGSDYMTPMIARYRGLSYFGTLVADVEQVQETVDLVTDERKYQVIEEEKNVPLARIPIMVKSRYCTTTLMPQMAHDECRYDPGCYFIVNGSEKVVLSIERLARNKILVHEKKKDGAESEFRAMVTSQMEELDSISYGYTVSLKTRTNGGIYFTGNGFADIPVFIVLRALGLGSDEEIVDMVVQMPKHADLEMTNALYHSVRECVDDKGEPLKTIQDAVAYLSTKGYTNFRFYSQVPEIRNKQRIMYVEKLLREDLLPHVSGDTRQKALYLTLMMHKLLAVMIGRVKVDDRDTFCNKRIDMPGILLGQLFRQSWNRMMKECGNYFRKRNSDDKSPPKMISQIKPMMIEQSFRSALLTGRWGMSRTKHGVARVLERLSFTQTVAQYRQIITPTLDEKNSKVSSMRHVHPSQWGFLCIVETPEGEKIGLVKNLALSATLTTTDLVTSKILKEYISNHAAIESLQVVDSTLFYSYFMVMVDGDLVGLTKNANDIVNDVTKMKLHNQVNRYIGIALDAENREIRIFTDSGRMVRPLLRVQDLNLYLKSNMMKDIDQKGMNPTKLKTWDDFLAKYPEVIEYVDIEQSPYTLISMYLAQLNEAKTIRSQPVASEAQDQINRFSSMYSNYTHCELHPCVSLGMTASVIPFMNSNQTPRLAFQYAQAKQAMGIYSTNWMNRFDISNVLYHPQVPIVTTRCMEYTGLMDLPNGENVIVAIAPYTGYNQEDSLVLNASSVARGMFRSTYLKKYNSTIEKNQVSSQDDIHTKPDRNLVVNIRADVNYDKLNQQGFVEEETLVENGDAILGKVSPIQPSEKSAKVFKDKSEVYKGFHMNPGYVDKVQTGILNGEGYEMYNMRIRSERIPQIGDKFCYTEDHEVLTTDGWVPIAEVTTNHRVACLRDGKKLEYQHPTEVVSFDYEGKLYEVNSKKVSLCVTPNHKMWVGSCHGENYRIEEAQDIYAKMRCYMNNCAEWVPEPCPEIRGDKFILPGANGERAKALDLEAWCIFFGIWIAEGSMEGKNKEGTKAYAIHIAAHKQRVKDALLKANEKLGFELRQKKERATDVEFNSWSFPGGKSLIMYMLPLSVGAVNKRLPSWCFALDIRHTRLLIEGMLLGDGHTMSNTTTRRYDTSSKGLADDFMRLCLHAGWAATDIIKDPAGHSNHSINGRPIVHTADAHRLTICTVQNRPIVNKYMKSKGLQQDSWKEGFQGRVYCCTVPSHVMYIRRDGLPIWCGNSSRSGQKSTAGILLPQEDMPFTEDGIVPDLIINPNCIPSRMTIGQLIETVLAKSGSIRGELKDGTAFESRDIDEICAELESLGYNRHGYETMYSGITGEKLDVQLFIGPCYYQRLKHMVADKIHARATGPMVMLTRQPPDGRTKNGGYRFGEMERDVAISHGIAAFLKERMNECSDKAFFHVCDKCGLIASKLKNSDSFACYGCNNYTDISLIAVPYATKLLFQELMAINIAPRIRTGKLEEDDI